MPYSTNSLVTRLIAAALIASALLMLNGCTALQRSSSVERLGAPIEGYNHSRSSAINWFRINGSGGSNVNVSSSGGQTCCVVLPVTWQPGLTAVVEWEEDPDPFAYGDWPEKMFSDGFYPVTADTFEKRHNVPKECSCPNAEDTAPNSSAKPSRYLASQVPIAARWP